MFEQTAMKASQISKYMILLDYPKAEDLVHRWMTQLEHHRGIDSFESALDLQLVTQYATLGNIQYRQGNDQEARTSFIKGLRLHEETHATSGQASLQDVQVHRTYTLLEWLTSQQTQEPSLTNDAFNMRSLRAALETDIWHSLKAEESKPLPYHKPYHSRWQKPKTARSKLGTQYNEDHLDSTKVMKLPMFAGVDEDKRPPSRSNAEKTMSKGTSAGATPVPRGPRRPLIPGVD